MFKKVIAAIGMPDACEPALIAALEIARQHEGKLFILHVLEATYRHECGPQESVRDFKTGEAVAPTHEYKEAVKQEMDKKCAGALKSYGNYEINIVEGRPGIEIRRWARKVGADLIVLGPHVERMEEEKELTGAPRGDTVEDVITYVTAPVLIVNSSMQKEQLSFKNILACVDFSRSCDVACKFAVTLARRYSSNLHLFHMVSAGQEHLSKIELEKEGARLREFCKVPKEIQCSYTVWGGAHPSSDILKIAHEKQIDLIVMGSHTRETGEKPYIGSAVEQVSSHSSCPVAVVTHPDAIAKAES